MIKVFAIHGMGKHSDDWWTNADNGVGAKVLKLKRYDKITADVGTSGTLADFCNDIEFIDLHYDNKNIELFDAANQSSSIDSLVASIEADDDVDINTDRLTAWKPSAEKLFASLNPFGENEFLKNNIWDVFLCSTTLTRHYLAVYVAEQILKHLVENADMEWAIIAHSLGTGLINDVLNYIDKKLTENGGNINPARCVALISNFSATILQSNSTHDVNHLLTSYSPVNMETTKVWPSKSGSARKSMCSSYIHTRHRLDPLSYLSEDMPNLWHNANSSFDRSRYHVLGHNTLNHLPQSLNADIVEMSSFLHSVPNYFANPEVHLRFFGYVNKDRRLLRAVESAQQKFTNESRANLGNAAQELLPPQIKSHKDWILEMAKRFV